VETSVTNTDSRRPPEFGDTTEERESLVAEAHRLAQERERASEAAEAPTAARVPRGPLAVVLSFILAVVAAWNVAFFTGGGPDGQAEEEMLLRASIYMVALSIDGYLEEFGRLPETLEEIGEDDPDYQYVPFESGYHLTVTGEQTSVTFRSGDNLAPFEAAFRSQLDGDSLP
jgi:hypothetical protein